jgi:hypothetical protein
MISLLCDDSPPFSYGGRGILALLPMLVSPGKLFQIFVEPVAGGGPTLLLRAIVGAMAGP